jgi:hypothetical protein
MIIATGEATTMIMVTMTVIIDTNKESSCAGLACGTQPRWAHAHTGAA